MKRTHALLISLLLAAAVLAGSFAALRTTRLSTQSAAPTRVSSTALARQSRALDRAEAALRAELRRKPPALPAVAAARPAAAPPATVVYHRPPAIVHVIHRHGGEHESEGGHEGGGDD